MLFSDMPYVRPDLDFLREKIEEDPQQPILIKTVRGLGYRMD